jgi:DNA helicase HerA-like ATPase
MFDVLKEQYSSQSKGTDTLYEVCRRLAEFDLFWREGSGREPLSNLVGKTMIIDLHGLPVLRELVAYLVIELIYREMCMLDDSIIRGSVRQMRTILVIDEAHNYLGHRNRFLEGTIREGRSKGVAVFLSSQSPDDFNRRGFDYRELIELLVAFQCEGASPAALQSLLGCTARAAQNLTTTLANLPPGEALTKGTLVGKEYCRFRSDPFYKAYP